VVCERISLAQRNTVEWAVCGILGAVNRVNLEQAFLQSLTPSTYFWSTKFWQAVPKCWWWTAELLPLWFRFRCSVQLRWILLWMLMLVWLIVWLHPSCDGVWAMNSWNAETPLVLMGWWPVRQQSYVAEEVQHPQFAHSQLSPWHVQHFDQGANDAETSHTDK